jgi:hypothetical protein
MPQPFSLFSFFHQLLCFLAIIKALENGDYLLVLELTLILIIDIILKNVNRL